MAGGKLKRLLLLSATLLICGIYIFISDSFVESAPQTETDDKVQCYVNGKEGISGTQIMAQKVHKKNYLFLPSGMNLSALKIHFSCPLGKWVTFNNRIIHGNVKIDVLNQGKYNKKEGFYQLMFQICDAEGLVKDYKLRIMESSDIPSVFLVSEKEEEGRSWVESTPDHSNVAEALVYELNEDGILDLQAESGKAADTGQFYSQCKKKGISV